MTRGSAGPLNAGRLVWGAVAAVAGTAAAAAAWGYTPGVAGLVLGGAGGIGALILQVRTASCLAARPREARARAVRGALLRTALRLGVLGAAGALPGISFPAAVAGLVIPVAVLALWGAFGSGGGLSAEDSPEAVPWKR